MLHVCVGENVYARDEQIAAITKDVPLHRYDGADIETDRLEELLFGQSLFGANECAVIADLSANKPTWEALAGYAEQDISGVVILVETKLDKRTKTYKSLQKHAKLIDCPYWSDRQRTQALAWLEQYAKKQGVTLDETIAKEMVERAIRPSDVSDAAIIDQQLLATTIAQLRDAGTLNRNMLDAVLAPSVHENVFDVFASALDGDGARVRDKIRHLKRDQDGHRMMGLLASQASNLAALVLGGSRPAREVAKAIGTHPFALSQLERYRRQLTRPDMAVIIDMLADADARLKRSQADPWTLIEKALVEISLHTKNSRQ